MAVQKRFLKLTEREAGIRVWGSSGSTTISLNTDLLHPNQELHPTKPRKVTICSWYWTGDTDVVIEIKRNNVIIASLQANAATMMPFSFTGSNFTENTEEGSDIVVEIRGGTGISKEAQLWMVVSKVSGYRPKIEIANFSVYDNPNKAGE